MAEYEPLGPIINSDPAPRQSPAAKHQNAAVNPNPQDFFSVPPSGVKAPAPPAIPAPSVPTPTKQGGKTMQKSIQIESHGIRNADFGGGQSSYLPTAERKVEAEHDIEIATKRAKKTTKQIIGMSISAVLFVLFVTLGVLSGTALILKWHK
ncbi:hypothetical protein M3Y94_01081700 [Aphelenchoides besseyi]|nr:hypothetical protein M3Y94_01081700 [Aphelenchoides besseyi]